MDGLRARGLAKPMRRLIAVAAGSLLALGCAGYAPPTQQMTDAQAASRAATELGAQKNPKAQLHLKFAAEQIRQAKSAMDDDDDNERATRLLMRANADAELALAFTRQEQAMLEADKAVDRSNAQSSTIKEQGAQP